MSDERIADLSAQIAAANAPKPDAAKAVPADEPKEPSKADPAPEGEGEQHEEAAASEDVERKPGKKPGVHQRIDELTREKYEARREAEELRKKLAELEAAKAAPAPEKKPAAASTEPTLEQFDFDVQAFTAARDKWVRQNAEREIEAKRKTESEQAERKRIADDFQKRVAKFEETNPGAWAEAVKAPIQYTPAMLEVIATSDKGPDLGVYLAQHLDEADRISKLSPVAAAAALGRIEASLSAPRQPEKQPSRAPAPPSTLGGPAPAKKEWGAMSTEEHIAAWRAKQANR
jgi:hypothetical protein